ncbi:MAG: hypothetical protein DHS20C18_51870 [Saprospiraceae bacterium]|nr:MAG: hypothetical protein DHS20C18_51870 [Saprospiraceae bacterium]
MDSNKRLISLDIFRGLTIAGMILVNNPGSWSNVYAPFLHADWDGCTPTDLVFPFFLFIVGVAIPLALGARKARGDEQGAIIRKILIRVALIFGLGLFLAAFPNFGTAEESPYRPIHYSLLALFMVAVFIRELFNQKHNRDTDSGQRWHKIMGYLTLASLAGMIVIGILAYDFSHLRIPGVLQRIALVYGICALLFLRTSWRTQVYIGVGLLTFYWLLMTLVPVPGYGPPNLEPEHNLGAWFDRIILGTDHLWSQSKVWDPEGFLSTLPAIVTGIIGMLTGLWIKSDHNNYKKLTGILGIGAILIAAGLFWDLFFPINKKLWTSSYVLYAGGIALLCLGVIYWLVDVLDYKRWTKPFVVYGMNALFVYIMSGIIAKLSFFYKVSNINGESVTLKTWIYDTFYLSWLSDFNASLAYGLSNVLLLWFIAWILYKNRVFIKV